jgi:hypothetical protein
MPAYTLTLATNGTVYNLNALIQAINPKESTNFSEISIQPDSGNANPILLGDASLATSRYGIRLASTSPPYQPRAATGSNSLTLNNVYALGVTSDNLVLHVMLANA